MKINKEITVKGEIVQNFTGKFDLYVKAKVSNKDFKFGEKVKVKVSKLFERDDSE